MKKNHRVLAAAAAVFLLLLAGSLGYYQYVTISRIEGRRRIGEEQRARALAEEQEETEAKEQARREEEAVRAAEEQARREEEQVRLAEEAKKQKIEELEEEARTIAAELAEPEMDALACADSAQAAQSADRVKTEIAAFRETHAGEEDDLLESSLEILGEAEAAADVLLQFASIDEMLASVYDASADAVAMNTSKNARIFRDAQRDIWKLPQKFPQKRAQYERVIARISEEWDYSNDDWNYESSTLKVSVEPCETSYTKYWVCHVRTFSPQQFCSALCGGTYGNPRVRTSQELASHNGVIGVNGSGFSYGSGEPAPGKTMIKDGQVYNDTYSNGNIMCVTQDGDMFTAAAGMTVEDLKNRGVRDTYCFGPTLVMDGKALTISGDFRQTYRYQRTAIGMVSPGEYYIVVIDGKGAGGSQGMTYEEMQQLFLDLGCTYAYNLDGGGSSTLVFKGRVINTLTDSSGERPCGDILYFIDAGDGNEGEDIVIHEEEGMLHPSRKGFLEP